MDDTRCLSHTKWECKYHMVFIPKCRRKTLFGQIRQHLGEVFHKLAAQKESRIEEGHIGQSFWARGFFVSTVGRDEAVIREYIKNQEAEDHRLEQLSLWR